MIANVKQYAISEKKLKSCIFLRTKLLRRVHMALNAKEIWQEIDDLQQQAELITKQLKE